MFSTEQPRITSFVVQKELAAFGSVEAVPSEVFRSSSQNFCPAGVKSPLLLL
jgi:hypothetical protein